MEASSKESEQSNLQRAIYRYMAMEGEEVHLREVLNAADKMSSLTMQDKDALSDLLHFVPRSSESQKDLRECFVKLALMRIGYDFLNIYCHQRDSTALERIIDLKIDKNIEDELIAISSDVPKHRIKIARHREEDVTLPIVTDEGYDFAEEDPDFPGFSRIPETAIKKNFYEGYDHFPLHVGANYTPEEQELINAGVPEREIIENRKPREIISVDQALGQVGSQSPKYNNGSEKEQEELQYKSSKEEEDVSINPRTIEIIPVVVWGDNGVLREQEEKELQKALLLSMSPPESSKEEDSSYLAGQYDES